MKLYDVGMFEGVLILQALKGITVDSVVQGEAHAGDDYWACIMVGLVGRAMTKVPASYMRRGSRKFGHDRV